MIILANMKMADMIHLDYHILMIISRFGIRLGFGDKTIQQVCEEYDINPAFFLEIINSFISKNYFPEKNFQKFSLDLIVSYLKKSHQYYLGCKIPEIDQLLQKMADSAVENSRQPFALIDRFFGDYKKELNIHISREEDHVYPYVFEVEKAFLSKKPDQKIVAKIRRYSIEDYKSEHDNVEDKLLDLKNILIKYITVPIDSLISEAVLFELFRLEADLRDHARLEDKILVPKVKYMEKWILDHYR